MKRLLVMMCLLSAVSLWPAISETVSELEVYNYGSYDYVLLEDGTAKIVDYDWEEEQISIPVTLDGHTVTEIDQQVFLGDSNFGPWLYSAKLPDGIRRIEEYAFFDNNLRWINLPQSLVAIGNSAIDPGATCIVSKGSYAEQYCVDNDIQFIYEEDCPDPCTFIVAWEGDYRYCALGDGPATIADYWGYDADVAIPSTMGGHVIEGIEPYAFYYGPGDSDYSLKSVEVPEGVKWIGGNAFSCRYGLTAINLPEGLEKIGDEAFFCCVALTSVRLPDSLSEIGVNPFIGCTALERIEVSEDNPWFEVSDGALYSKADKRLICVFDSSDEHVVYVQEGTKKIGMYAFRTFDKDNENYTIVLPESIKAIEADDAWYDFSHIRFVVTPGSFAEQYCIEHECDYIYELYVGKISSISSAEL